MENCCWKAHAYCRIQILAYFVLGETPVMAHIAPASSTSNPFSLPSPVVHAGLQHGPPLPHPGEGCSSSRTQVQTYQTHENSGCSSSFMEGPDNTTPVSCGISFTREGISRYITHIPCHQGILQDTVFAYNLCRDIHIFK